MSALWGLVSIFVMILGPCLLLDLLERRAKLREKHNPGVWKERFKGWNR